MCNADERPNVLVILCDDIGAHELAIYGHQKHRTPNLDDLAKTGIWFTTGFSTPICHPTRFCIMTGQYGHHNGDGTGYRDVTLLEDEETEKARLMMKKILADKPVPIAKVKTKK